MKTMQRGKIKRVDFITYRWFKIWGFSISNHSNNNIFESSTKIFFAINNSSSIIYNNCLISRNQYTYTRVLYVVLRGRGDECLD